VSERKRKPKSTTWEDRLSAQVGQNVADARTRLGMTAQQLSDAMTALGSPVGRPAVSQIENGQRAVSLAEAIAMAAALDVPLVELVFKPGPGEVEALAGRSDMTAAEAADWLRGELPLRPRDADRGEWLAESAERRWADQGVDQWGVMGRAERRLWMYHRRVEKAHRELLAAQDEAERQEALGARQAALGPAIAAARTVEELANTFAKSAGWRLDRATRGLVARYAGLDVPGPLSSPPADGADRVVAPAESAGASGGGNG
jgi:transcriptional regulator with XRE-family HTH domain